MYANLFADWLHIHFIIRTVIILFVLWMIIFLFAQLIQYIFAPMALLFFYHVIFRAWNFLFVETPHEWLYIRYHEKANFPEIYLRLCDKVKQNRLILAHTKYKGVLFRSRRFAMQFMIISAIAATLWASAFGLHHEYSAPTFVAASEEPEEEFDFVFEDEDDFEDENEISSEEFSEKLFEEILEKILVPVFDFEDDSLLFLNETGRQGARLRSGAGIENQTVIEILWDDAVLVFLNEYVPDENVNGLFWLKVRSPSETTGFISSQYIERNDKK
ncbi:MAG: SH3 domain-containing protein [Defluviitaleaceae bacterium]|nr:SH3 domain-containing protein [Defluviitaleaceae bacterium]